MNRITTVLIAAEAYPFAKVGGLADVVGALPKYLKSLNIEPIIIIPLYSEINREKYAIKKVNIAPQFIGDNFRSKYAEFYSSYIPYTEIPVYFIANDDYFNRNGIYNDKTTNEVFEDDAERFIFFSSASLILLRSLEIRPDIIHCNDYQTSSVLALLNTKYQFDPFFSNTKTIFAIHNLAYQGNFDKDILQFMDISVDLFQPLSPFEFYGKVNLMKLGIAFANLVITVSPTYAKEIMSYEFGYGLDGVLNSVSHKLIGILNGVDYSDWNPSIDKFLDIHYSIDDLSGKKELKKRLLDELIGPKAHYNYPLISMVSRLVEQKGFDLIKSAIYDIMQKELTLIILGEGNKEYVDFFKQIENQYPDKFRLKVEFNQRLAHFVEAGSDMFLMPSKYEPCGLNQMYSLKYGTIPIVRKTGGLADTVINFDSNNDDGVGFSFEDYKPEALFFAIKRALYSFQDKYEWESIMKRGMELDFSWSKSSKKYVKVYNALVNHDQIDQNSFD